MTGDPQQLICWCFGHRVADIERDAIEQGRSTIAIAVRDACRAGLSRCAQMNPSGTCCLGLMHAIARRASASTAPDCCAAERDEP